MSLNIIIPVFNCESTIEVVVNRLENFLLLNGIEYEIIIVDDKSKDNTLSVLRKIKSNHPYIKVLTHKRNQGPCSGLKSSIPYLTKDYCLLYPADEALPLHDIIRFLSSIKGYDLVLGYTVLRGDYSRLRKIQSRVYISFFNFLFHTQFNQINYVALYDTKKLKNIKLISTGVAIHGEILIRFKQIDYRIKEIEIGYNIRKAGKASGGKIKTIIKTVFEIIKVYINIKWSYM